MTSPETRSLRLSAWMLLAGQVLYVAATRMHAGGDANHHASIFTVYAADNTWMAVHLGQFAAMAVLLTGLAALVTNPVVERKSPRWLFGLNLAAIAAALALYGALQAVDGVALKQAAMAWADADASVKLARFANAEGIRWLEWGMRSYFDFTFGSCLIACGLSTAMVGRKLKPIGLVMMASGAAYLAQGWIAGSEGFSPSQSMAIVVGWVVSAIWMIWLIVVASLGREKPAA
jgi:hypothetical protein